MIQLVKLPKAASKNDTLPSGFPTGVENMALFKIWLGEGLSQYMGRAWRAVLKNTCEGVHLLAQLPAIILQAWNLLKMNFFTYIFQEF